MRVVPSPDPNDPAQPTIHAVVAHVLRWGRAPRVLVATDGSAASDSLVSELRRRELDVVAVTHARDLHAVLRAHFEDDDQRVDIVVAASDLPGCSPYHGIAWARRNGFSGPVFVGAPATDHVARKEAAEAMIEVAPKALLLPTIDRALVQSLRRVSERPSVAA